MEILKLQYAIQDKKDLRWSYLVQVMIVSYGQVSVTTDQVCSDGHGITKNTRIELCIFRLFNSVALIHGNASSITTLKIYRLVSQP